MLREMSNCQRCVIALCHKKDDLRGNKFRKFLMQCTVQNKPGFIAHICVPTEKVHCVVCIVFHCDALLTLVS